MDEFNSIWQSIIAWPLWLKLFCFFMIALTVLKCIIKKEHSEKVSRKYRTITSLIAIFTCLTGAYYLNETLPSPPSPQINQLFFYGQGNLREFQYCCEFEVRNDGETPCSLEKVEFVLDGTEFTNARTGQVRIASGNGGGRLGGGRLGGGSVNNDFGSSYFPQSLSKMNQGFCVIGKAKNPNGVTPEGNNISLEEINIKVKFHFKSKDRSLETEVRTVPILHGTIQGMRF